jgi:hypothetical protein
MEDHRELVVTLRLLFCGRCHAAFFIFGGGWVNKFNAKADNDC